MKKIFTLVFALGTFALVQAQPGTRDNRDIRQPDQRNTQQVDQRDNNRGYDNGRDVVYNKPYDNDNRFVSVERRRDMEIAQINREYDFKIQKVRNSYFTSRWDKERQIRFLQAQRQQEIKMVYRKFSERRDRDFDRYDHDNRRY